MPRLVGGLLLVLSLTSCTKWVAADRPLPQLLPETGPRPGTLRIYTERQGLVVVRSPRLRNDSLIWIRGGFETGVPVSEIRGVERTVFDGTRTFVTVLVTAGLGGYIGASEW